MNKRSLTHRQILLFAGTILMVTGACATVQKAFAPIMIPTAMGGSSGQIVFISNRDDNDGDDTFDTDIYLMDADGSNVKRLTSYEGSEWAPDISPDGKRILFMSSHAGGREIFVMDIDGTNVTQVTKNRVEEGSPVWSWDGRQIAFIAKMSGDASAEVYLIAPDGSNQIRLTSNSINESDLAWSPDGSKIAYTTFGKNGYDIFVMDVDGTHPTQVTNDNNFNVHPCWLNDQTIAYVSWYTDTIEAKNKFSIFVTLAGEEFTILFTDKLGIQQLKAGVHTINTNGSSRIILTDKEISSFGAACSPDGRHIIFSASGTKGTNIYMIDSDGSNIVPLTEGEKSNLAPEW